MYSKCCYLPLLVFWCTWKLCNLGIFENKAVSVHGLIHQVDYLMHYYLVPGKKMNIRNIGPGPMLVYPYGFLEGVAVDCLGGVGFFLALSNVHSLKFTLGCGQSTNTRAELLALWALLVVEKDMGLPSLHIFGDSFVIINWENNMASLDSLNLGH